MNESTFISTIANNPHSFFHINKEKIKTHGIEKAIFYSALVEYQFLINKLHGSENIWFSLDIKQLSTITGLPNTNIESCIKYWKEKKVLENIKGDIEYYRIDLENGGY